MSGVHCTVSQTRKMKKKIAGTRELEISVTVTSSELYSLLTNGTNFSSTMSRQAEAALRNTLRGPLRASVGSADTSFEEWYTTAHTQPLTGHTATAAIFTSPTPVPSPSNVVGPQEILTLLALHASSPKRGDHLVLLQYTLPRGCQLWPGSQPCPRPKSSHSAPPLVVCALAARPLVAGCSSSSLCRPA